MITNLATQSIDIPTETIKLAESDSSVSPASLSGRLSESSPRYTLYHYPDSDAVIFIYTCPSNSSIKERMLYASTRRVAIDIAEAEGLNVTKKVRFAYEHFPRGKCRLCTDSLSFTDRGIFSRRDH